MKLWIAVCSVLLASTSLSLADTAPTPPAAQAAPPPNLDCPGAAYRQFDFMLGKWNVGPTSGADRPSKSEWVKLSPCVILEQWRPKSGYKGFSLNFYDQSDNKWHQHWMDATGDATDYVGEWANGKLVFTADDVVTPAIQDVKLTMTFELLPSGDVRQSGTISTDGGKTYTSAFDLTYTPDP